MRTLSRELVGEILEHRYDTFREEHTHFGAVHSNQILSLTGK